MESRLVESPLRTGEQRVLAATAVEALAWAWVKFGDRCCVLSSMQDATVVDLAMQVDRSFPVVFLDTGYHFVETWDTLRAIERHYGISVEVISPTTPPKTNVAPGECCQDKTAMLEVALGDRDAWVSGIRRPQTSARSNTSLIETDRHGRTKINPVAQWSNEDHARYVEAASVIQNPLLARGYTSVGCEPCTSVPTDGGDLRSGRWAGTNRTECGLHV